MFNFINKIKPILDISLNSVFDKSTKLMDRWRLKVAVVTGASSGIGWAITKELLQANMMVIGLSLEVKSEKEIAKELGQEQSKLFHQKQCDLSSVEEIKTAFSWIKECFKKIHVLVNNVGMCEFSRLLDENNEESLKRVLDVNLMAAVFCTKEAYKLMKISMSDKQECHVINMCSLLGHYIMPHIPACGFNLYPVAKHALRATNEVLRQELSKDKLVRLSLVSPGLTATKFGSYLKKPSGLEDLPETKNILQAQDIARAVKFILESPLHVTIAEMIVVPTEEKY